MIATDSRRSCAFDAGGTLRQVLRWRNRCDRDDWASAQSRHLLETRKRIRITPVIDGTQVGQYRNVRLLGTGGMGEFMRRKTPVCIV